MRLRALFLTILMILAAGLAWAQAPTGSILGTVTDPSGAVVPGANVTVENRQTSLRRAVQTSERGAYTFTAIPPGIYQVKVEAAGFKTTSREVELFVGRELTLDFSLSIGASTEVVEVSAETAQVNLTDNKVDGVISRSQITAMPLNGRNALELARLQPGVLVSSGVPSGKNGFVGVSVAGETDDSTRVTVDGGSVQDSVTGGSWQNFSQEVVQEFQISVGNFDPSTGITSSGAINLVTRSGSNDFHGTAFAFFRDNSYAANPQLVRNPLNPDPEFDRQQYGWLFSGPVIRDKFFWLTSIERTRQRGVSMLVANNPELESFNQVKAEPFDVMLQTHKLDWNLGQNHRMNFRYSRDGNQGRAGGGTIENQRINQNSADQYLFNWNALFGSHFVNDFRAQFNKYSNYYKPTPEAQELGYPRVSIRQSSVRFGIDDNSPQSTLMGRFEMHNNVSQQVGSHGLKYGVTFERDRGAGSWQYSYPASITLYSPAEARAAGIQVPTSFKTKEDLLQLPVQGFTFGVGDPTQPPYHPERAAINHRVRFYFGDSWKATRSLTLNFALSYSFEDNLINQDLPKPQSLSKILNGNLNTTRRDFNNLAPRFGFAWSPGTSGKTVIRGGWGMFYDTFQMEVRLIERTMLAPFGVGYFPLSQNEVPNIFAAIYPKEKNLDFLRKSPTQIRGSLLLKYLPDIRGAFEQEFAKYKGNEDMSLRTIDVFQSGYGIVDPDLTTPYAMHYTLGMQRELPHGIVLTADGEFKQSVHRMFQADYNRYRRVAALGGPVDKNFGEVSFFQTGGTARYKALLVRAEKRFSHRYQFIAGYALSSFLAMNGGGLYLGDDVSNKDNWKDSFGPQDSDRRHRLVAAFTFDLPKDFQVSVIADAISRGAGNLGGGNYDYNGDGTQGDRLPYLSYNAVNRGISEDDVSGLVSRFNSDYAGKKDMQGATIAPIPALPSKFWLGDAMWSQDVRVTKRIKFGERFSVTGIAEVFNIFNIANLGGFSGDLYSSRFGQPTSRISNVFGTGGPRAFQFAVRLGF